MTSNHDLHNEENIDERENKICELGSTEVNGKHGNIFCMSIIGQIEGHLLLPPQNKTTKYEHILPMLVNVEEDEKIDGLLILLNTMGGDVEAGLAIAELIAGMKKPTVSLVLGGGHSIGVPLAVAAKYSFIAPTATMTIHPIRMNGLVIGVPQTFDYFSKMQERIVNFVTRQCPVLPDKFRNLMLNTSQLANDVGTILFGQEAVDLGLVSAVGSLSDAMNKLSEMKNQ